MEISTATQTNMQANSKTATADRAVSSDFTTFLKLLTTQLRNQDPLKPLDSTEFVAQLASFSAVEQQVKTNDTLAAISALMGGPTASGLSAWIGTEVRVLKGADFTGSPVELFVSPDDQADQARLVVRDPVGQTVQNSPLPLGADVIEWAGVADDGTPFAPGQYSFSLESLKNGQVIKTEPVEIYAQVREARMDNGAIVLVFGDGSTTPAAEVTAVRQPQSETAD